MATVEKSKMWKFEFVIEHIDFKTIDIECPEELLEYIVDWVEKHNLQMGGGYSALSEDEPVEPIPYRCTDCRNEQKQKNFEKMSFIKIIANFFKKFFNVVSRNQTNKKNNTTPNDQD